jgi:hypothetical protein
MKNDGVPYSRRICSISTREGIGKRIEQRETLRKRKRKDRKN